MELVHSNLLLIMKESKEILADWLRDAHAMESNQVHMLEKQSDGLSDFPAIQRRVADHAEESRRHAELVEQALDSIGEDTSALKEAIGRFTGQLSPLAAAMAADEPVKIALANTGLEHFEIACYRSLKAAAEHCGQSQISQIAAEILRDEENMARYLEGEIELITRTHLDQEAGAGVAR
jgi:ferritin-like metal-binding protein YciE